MLNNFFTRLWKDKRGQDLIEYALVVAFISVTAGAINPTIYGNMSKVFSRVGVSLSQSSSQGS